MNNKIKNNRVKKSKKAESISASKKKEIINLDNEIVIGLKKLPTPKKINNKKVKVDKRKKIEKQNDQKVNKVKLNEKKQMLTKKQRQAIKKRRTIFRIARWTFLFLLLLGGLIYFLFSSVFNIKNIEVVDNVLLSDEQIVNLSKVQIDENMFKINKKKISNSIKEESYVESVTIKRKLPSTLQISVKERQATFMIKLGEVYIYLNNQGYILEFSNVKLTLPFLEGYQTEIENLVVGNRMCNEDLEKFEIVLQIIESAESNNILDLLTAIDISDKNDLKIKFEGEGKVAYLGDASYLGTRMLYVKKMLEKEAEYQGEIFVNMNLNEKDPYFREEV